MEHNQDKTEIQEKEETGSKMSDVSVLSRFIYGTFHLLGLFLIIMGYTILWSFIRTCPKSPNGESRKVFTVDGIDYVFHWHPPGKFTMGRDYVEHRLDRNWDWDQHTVRFSQGFWLLETEVTQAMWESVMGENPSKFKGARNPVEQVSWDDGQEFCKKLSQKLGRQVQLPTEDQWEYASRTYGTSYPLKDFGWYSFNSDMKPHEVGLKKPNGWGLYDMSGNVSEWRSDWYGKDYYASSPKADPTGPEHGSYRVVRGGNWEVGAKSCRPSYRHWEVPGTRNEHNGPRVLVVPVPED